MFEKKYKADNERIEPTRESLLSLSYKMKREQAKKKDKKKAVRWIRPAAAVAAAALGAVLRKSAPELALLLAVAAGVWIVFAAADGLRSVAALIDELTGMAGLSEELLEPVVKTVALSVLTKVTAEVCRSAGESGLAAFVETAGAVLALAVAVPLIRAVTVLVAEMLQ